MRLRARVRASTLRQHALALAIFALFGTGATFAIEPDLVQPMALPSQAGLSDSTPSPLPHKDLWPAAAFRPIPGSTLARFLPRQPGSGSVAALQEPEPETPAAEDSLAETPERGLVYPDLIVSSGILVDGLQFDLPMPWGQEEFEDFRASFLSSGGRKWLSTVMTRALPYLDYIEAKIAEYGVPREFAFLPVIESEYSPNAVSRSGATGLWQFMRNSIDGYGIRIDDWVDERKDFMKSTDAALRKLKDNYAALNDWFLALAAYNAGLGAVSRALRGMDNPSFWELYDAKKLSREPRSYVPKFLAVASILSYPELHGLPSEWGTRQSWSAIETARQVDLSILAERSGIPLATLRNGNPELKYQVTPPTAAHLVKVPADKAEEAKKVLSEATGPLFRYDIYKVKSGDTMSAVAKRYGTPLSMIIQANPGLNPDKIRIGQTVIIPHLPGTTPGTVKTKNGDTLDFNAVYVVKKGDTLWEISLAYDIQPDLLAEKNGIGVNSILSIGQRLKVPAR